MKSRFLLPAVAAAALAACEDPTRVQPRFETIAEQIALFSLGAAELNQPVAIDVERLQPVRLEPGTGYDIAFDVNDQGNVVLLPPGVTGGPGQTGLQDTTAAFGDVEVAPVSGYVNDDSLVVAPGTTVLVRTTSPSCSFSLQPYIYAKLVVDSIGPQRDRLYVTARVNPNCGFRGLTEGIPPV